MSCGEWVGTSEINLEEGLCVMYWPKLLPAMCWSMETLAASVNVADEMKLMTVTFALKTTIGGRMTLTMTVTKSILIEHQ